MSKTKIYARIDTQALDDAGWAYRIDGGASVAIDGPAASALSDLLYSGVLSALQRAAIAKLVDDQIGVPRSSVVLLDEQGAEIGALFPGDEAEGRFPDA